MVGEGHWECEGWWGRDIKNVRGDRGGCEGWWGRGIGSVRGGEGGCEGWEEEKGQEDNRG